MKNTEAELNRIAYELAQLHPVNDRADSSEIKDALFRVEDEVCRLNDDMGITESRRDSREIADEIEAEMNAEDDEDDEA